MLITVTNILFVCIGNSCRSQMAEGFARTYGADVMRAWSAGLAPAPIVQPLTVQVMNEKNVDIASQFPKSIHELDLGGFDLIINMSGQPLPMPVRGSVRTWKVDDPMAQPEEVYVRVRDQIEGLVMQMVLDLRRTQRKMPAGQVKPEAVEVGQKPVVVDTNSQRYGFGRVRRARD